MSDDIEIVVGIHSIVYALGNIRRMNKKLLVTEEGFGHLKKHPLYKRDLLNGVDVQELNDENFVKLSQQTFQKLDYNYFRIPSKIMMISDSLPSVDINEFYSEIKGRRTLKIIAIENITDIHNGAAILRTSAFYGADYFLLSSKGNFKFTPSFYRIASGAADIVPIVKVGGILSVLKKIMERDIICIGLAEKGKRSEELSLEIMGQNKRVLIIGSEDTGLSHALQRQLTYIVSLDGPTPFTTLNASVAATVAMERFFK